MKRWTKRGSTLVEVLMAISVLAVGASGIIALQKVSIVSNRNAKNLEIANEIAHSWAERLHTDSLVWNHPSSLNPNSDIGETRWLSGANVKSPGDTGADGWFRPDNGNIHGVHNAFGKDDRSDNKNGPFCVNLRLTWLRPDQDLIRAEVRVYWLRDNIQSASQADKLSDDPMSPLCADAPDIEPENMDLYHMVNVTTALRKNLPY